MKLFKKIILSVACGLGLFACSDNMESEHYYTFTGEMMSDYITTREQYSDFATIVKRAELMDLLSSYGHYTCFLPSNAAFAEYYKARGIASVNDLTDEECDTIAKTHLIGNMYSTIEMPEGTLNTANMNRRYIQITHGLDNDSNAVVFLNRSAHIYFETQDDSVQNGIVHPISQVLENSNSGVAELMRDNPRVSIFYEALVATGINEEIGAMKDENYDPKKYTRYRYKSHTWTEVATVPDTKKYGFTVFVVPDSVLNLVLAGSNVSGVNYKNKYGLTKTGFDGLVELAKAIYDETYPEDAGKYDDDFKNPKNPLNRFVRYCILTRDVKGINFLTGRVLTYKSINETMGTHTDRMNPIDWYHTLLPNTMMKCELLTVQKWVGPYCHVQQNYLNRRWDDKFQIRGSEVKPTLEAAYIQDAPNGRYFYVDDIVAFTKDVRDKVQNMRIRMDFSTVFPEIMTNDMRQNGDPTTDDNNSIADETFKNGRNYFFPAGYLDGVTSKGNCFFVYRRPHINFWSYAGDEFNLFGDYDFEFRLPPVPYSGEWQVRLGFCALDTRGIAQIYFDGVPQGIPLDMRMYLNDPQLMGTEYTPDDDGKYYNSLTDEEKAEDQKALKNKGYYRGPRGGYHTNGDTKFEWVGKAQTYRRVLCQAYFDNTKDHYLRIRCASKSKTGNNNEFMMDYLELVPKSVYGVANSGEIEDDL